MTTKDNDRVVMTRSDEYDVKRVFKDFGIDSNGHSITELLGLIKMVGQEDDSIKSWSEYPTLPPGTVGMMFLKTYYNINISRSSLVLAAVLMDAVATAGLASAALSISGLSRQGIARINPKNGEYCSLLHTIKIKEAGSEVSPDAVFGMISGEKCPFVGLNCRLMSGDVCNAMRNDILNIFGLLNEKGALDGNDGTWKVPI
jgi:hypothetical protein